jgi:hypothetical protein
MQQVIIHGIGNTIQWVTEAYWSYALIIFPPGKAGPQGFSIRIKLQWLHGARAVYTTLYIVNNL